ncbi:LOW QUALITY PROTEIN: transforming acidic coiled-coil-containing protein 2-like [Haliotis rubra]|uniref:LOW QUALITY PROTEIN: transforming acidic coiled-coil-containing protein 2-like n=1 Tax=Haliotis rubra TaxID=36100 RepID=UPI001EE5E1D1|nr:LOW QUALITY PROTEIN: transforming acidic coiled-coil-containing protein 2-like [Haliotis rubra]
MDENTPPAQMARGKTVSGSPSIRSVLKPVENVVQLQSPGNKNLKVPSQPSPLATAPTTTNSDAYTVSADSDDEIQFQTKAYTNDENADPFKSKGGLANSPVTSVLASSVGNVAASPARAVDSPVRSKEDVDPFKTRSQIANSPLAAPEGTDDDSILASMTGQADAQDEDAFKTKVQLQNSPPKEIKNTPVKAIPDDSDVDPFKPKSQIANSPVIPLSEVSIGLPDNLDEVDPFKTKSQIANSPVIPPSEVSIGLPDNLDEVDPFKPKSQIANSPVIPPSEAATWFTDNLDEVDPFKTKSQIANSPVIPPSEAATGLPDNLDEIDPFKTKSQIANSPVIPSSEVSTGLPDNSDEIDPFKPKSQVANSPVIPPSTVSTGLPDTLDDIDPFKLKSQIANSPSTASIEVSNGLPENLDEFDPFKSKNMVQNSPVKCSAQTTVEAAECLKILEDGEPKEQDSNQTSECSSHEFTEGLPDSLDGIDVFKPMAQMVNSPCQNSTINSTMGTADLTVIENLLDDIDQVDPFQPKSEITNSPVKTSPESTDLTESDLDPFKPKSQMQNSPIKETPSKTAEASMGLPDTVGDVDPFKSKSQIPNTPLGETPSDATGNLPENLDVDPFKTKSQIPNSPVKETLLAGTGDLPENLEDVDPFKSKSQVPNSPLRGTPSVATGSQPENLDVDPFKTKSQIPNSPLKETPLTTVGLPETLDAVDPFKTKSQVVNTPDMKKEVLPVTDTDPEIDPFKTSNQVANSPLKIESTSSAKPVTDIDTTDPFKTKSQVMNSPIKPTAEVKQAAPKAVAKQKTNLQHVTNRWTLIALIPSRQRPVWLVLRKPVSTMPGDADPFQMKSKIQNSPGSLPDGDPFKTITQLHNSPVKAGNPTITVDNGGDPFQSKSKVPNSPVKPCGLMTGLDPLVPSVQVEHSQQVPSSVFAAELNLIGDPFATTVKVGNSPAGKTQPASTVMIDSQASRQQPVQASCVDPFDNLDAFNPFQTKSGLGNTNSNFNNNGLPKTPRQNSGGMDLIGDNVMCMIATGETAGGQEGMNFAQDDFRPANEVFSDPNVWDMLETFGSNNTNAESDLSRMSLYVKFDPLVNSKPAHSPAGIARGIQKMEVVKDGDESIMLMGTPPRGGGRRRSILVQRRPPAAVAKTIFEEEDVEEKKEAKPLLVDLIFSCSPEAEELQQEKKSDQTEGLTQDQAAPTPRQDTKKDETFFEVVEVLKYSETDVKKMLKKQRQELTLESQGRQLSLEQELSKKQTALSVEAKHYKELADQLEVKNKQMRQVVVEYESFINELVNEKEKNSCESKESKNKLKSERNQAIEDLQSVEKSFADLHRRYEKVKSVLEDYRKNEETLKKTNKSLIAKMQQQDEAMNKLKTQAETKIKQAREEREKEKSSSNAENIKLQAALKKSVLHSQGLEKTLEQKGREIAELTDLCDTLISQVGGGS